MASDPNENITLNKIEARQGSNRPKVIYVLVASLALIVIVFGIVAMFNH